ncbi:ser thr phosphatase family protein [Cystoisospora suis]|uniref:Ser thr phosphatase family protein n=1 Tax=Cystoisospora suis TaxID=483139 RepID=A0A2C6KMP1_9APIC|nr:ser thr phosphatase family protein [Cystoisospora suis]
MERRGRLSSSGIARPVVFFLSSVFLRLDAAMGFRSLVPLSSRGTDAPPGLTVGHSGIFATPPGLLLSGKRSLSCSCISQVEVRMDGPSVSLYPRNTARGSDSFAPLVDGDGSSRRPLFCCSDKDEALQSVHEAPDGVSFASIGDTGLLTNALRRNTKTLAEWSSTLDIRWINLLGDNFYPHGVIGVDDPIWDDIFNIPFGFASLEKVAIFPVLGNHDYYTDPYAQIARYLRNATVPDVVAGVALASEASTFEGPISTFAGVDVVKLSQAHAVFPWIHLKKTNKGMKFLKNVDMRGVEGDRWRFPNYWYFTRHVFRNVPRHLSNPFKVNEKLDSVSPIQ